MKEAQEEYANKASGHYSGNTGLNDSDRSDGEAMVPVEFGAEIH